MRLCSILRPVVALFAIAALGAAMLTPSLATADWSGGVQGGAVIRNGEQSNRLRLSLSNNDRPLSQHIYADWISGAGEDSYGIGYLPRYWLTDALYGFGELSLRIDSQIGIDREIREAVGLGYQLLGNATQTALIEGGIGLRQLAFSNPALEDRSEPFARARGYYLQTINDLLRIDLDASIGASESVTETSAEVGVTVKLGTVAATIGYRVILQRIDGQADITDDTATFALNYFL